MNFDGEISPERLKEIFETVAKKGMKITYADFTVSEIRIIMRETCLNKKERLLAEMKYIECMKNTEICDALNCESEKTLYCHIKDISLKLRTTANRIFK